MQKEISLVAPRTKERARARYIRSSLTNISKPSQTLTVTFTREAAQLLGIKDGDQYRYGFDPEFPAIVLAKRSPGWDVRSNQGKSKVPRTCRIQFTVYADYPDDFPPIIDFFEDNVVVNPNGLIYLGFEPAQTVLVKPKRGTNVKKPSKGG